MLARFGELLQIMANLVCQKAACTGLVINIDKTKSLAIISLQFLPTTSSVLSCLVRILSRWQLSNTQEAPQTTWKIFTRCGWLYSNSCCHIPGLKWPLRRHCDIKVSTKLWIYRTTTLYQLYCMAVKLGMGTKEV